MARYPNLRGSDAPFLSPFPLTDQGSLAAIDFARQMCSEKSRDKRINLYI